MNVTVSGIQRSTLRGTEDPDEPAETRHNAREAKEDEAVARAGEEAPREGVQREDEEEGGDGLEEQEGHVVRSPEERGEPAADEVDGPQREGRLRLVSVEVPEEEVAFAALLHESEVRVGVAAVEDVEFHGPLPGRRGQVAVDGREQHREDEREGQGEDGAPLAGH